MAVQQRACGHLVPASMVRCPTCGATIGAPVHEQPPKVAARNRPIVAVMVLAVVACTALVGVLGLVIVRNRPESLERHRVGDGWIAGAVVPLEDVGLAMPDDGLPILGTEQELRLGPPVGNERERVTDEATGVSLAPFLRTTIVHPDGAAATADGWCRRLAWYVRASRNGYVEAAQLCAPAGAGSTRSLLALAVAGRGVTIGTYRSVTVDGHRGAAVTVLAPTPSDSDAGVRAAQVVQSHVMVDTGKGMLHLAVELPLVDEGGAPDPMPFVDTVRIP